MPSLSKTYEEWLEVFNEDFEGCVEPVLTFPEACEHPQLKAREMIVTIPKKRWHYAKQIASV